MPAAPLIFLSIICMFCPSIWNVRQNGQFVNLPGARMFPADMITPSCCYFSFLKPEKDKKMKALVSHFIKDLLTSLWKAIIRRENVEGKNSIICVWNYLHLKYFY